MNVLAVSDAVKPLIEFIDKYGQWFCLNIVYKKEIQCLFIALCLLAVRRKGIKWGIIFWSLWALVLFYLILYRMHWYSWIAWPVMMIPLCLSLSRLVWYRVIYVLKHPVVSIKLLPGLFRKVYAIKYDKVRQVYQKAAEYILHPLQSGKCLRSDLQRTKRALLTMGAIAIGIWIFWHALSIPFRFFLALLAAAVVIFGIGIVTTKICLQGFDEYIRSDLRLRLYLDAVRGIRAKGIRSIGSFLSYNRLEDPDLPGPGINFWTIIFRVHNIALIRWILRFLASRERMPSIKSKFVIQCVEYTRQQIWSRYASIRYGQFETEPFKDPLDAYLERIGQYGNLPTLTEFDNRDLRKLRISWLALTEALAECHVFSSPVKRSKAQVSLNLLKAAELLGQAGEIQHQIVRELIKYRHNDEKDDEQDIPFETEVRLAIHFLDLSARCIENWLAPNAPNEAGRRELLELYEHFCGDILADRDFSGNLLEFRLRRILLERYPLIARLKLLLSHDDQTSDTKDVADLNESPVCEPSGEILTPRLTFEADMAQFGQIGALSSLYLDRRQGDKARFPWLSGNEASHDPLAALECLVHKSIETAGRCAEPEYRVRNGEHHVLQLAGLSIEQEMEYLHPGSSVWWELCQLAADIYCSCHCYRIRVVCAMAKNVIDRDSEVPPNEHRSKPDDIIELS